MACHQIFGGLTSWAYQWKGDTKSQRLVSSLMLSMHQWNAASSWGEPLCLGDHTCWQQFIWGMACKSEQSTEVFSLKSFPHYMVIRQWERTPVCESLSLWFCITFPLISSTGEPSKNLVWTVYKQELAALFLLIRVALAYKQFSKPNTCGFTSWRVWAMNIVIIMNIGTR